MANDNQSAQPTQADPTLRRSVGDICSIVLEDFVQAQFESRDPSEGPKQWTHGFYRFFLKKRDTIENRFFLNSPLTVQSMLLNLSARSEIKHLGQISEPIGAAISEWAQTDYDVFRMAQQRVFRASIDEPRLPETLHDLAKRICHGAQPPKKRGDVAWKIQNRNRVGMAILLVLTHQEAFAMQPTRGETSPRVSALDILVEASSGLSWASVSDSGADEIWRNRERWKLEWALLLIIKNVRKEQAALPSTDFVLAALEQLKTLASGRKAKNKPDEPKA